MIKEQPNTLLKCPFCGGEAKLMTSAFFSHDALVVCKKCGSRTLTHTSSSHEDAKMNAIQAWNRRRPVDDVVEALKKPIWIEHTDDLTLNEIAETAIKQTREVAIQRVKEILNE